MCGSCDVYKLVCAVDATGEEYYRRASGKVFSACAVSISFGVKEQQPDDRRRNRAVALICPLFDIAAYEFIYTGYIVNALYYINGNVGYHL